ncbi:putative nuclease HARBI1 [Merluccius polli]|uniref:Nuclease HARBI1 n=1 Tax=Merluccius polli TaxID=89951 RepID=A0AA47MMS0_MERPO|nr:putative nuclease HARBI1 [Merluccius polli]
MADRAAFVCLCETFYCQRSRVLAQLNEEEEEELRVRNLIVQSSIPRIILKTGVEWGRLFDMDERTFYRHLRVNHAQFDYITEVLRQQGLDREQEDNEIPLKQKVSLFLWYLANQNSFRELSDKFDVAQSSAHRCVVEVLQTLCTMVPTFINWFTECEKLSVSAAFRAMCGIENIIGAIDGCHIKLQRPPIRGGDYLNRKGYYSIVLQGIVDSRGKFRDIFVGAPGRVHDSRILRKSTFFERSAEKMGGYMLLGDSAYISREYAFITTPKRDNGALTIHDQRQNTQISRGRVVVEQAFGRLKCKWRRLRDLQNTRLDVVVMLIMSACMLHNLCAGPIDICEDHPAGCPRHEDENI